MATHTEEDFEAKFTPVEYGEEEAIVRNREQVPGDTPTHFVWSAVDGEGDHGIDLVPGYLFFEAIYYIITEEPWTDAEKDNVYAWVTDADFEEAGL